MTQAQLLREIELRFTDEWFYLSDLGLPHSAAMVVAALVAKRRLLRRPAPYGAHHQWEYHRA